MNYYHEQLAAITAWVEGLNELEDRIKGCGDVVPYLGKIPVMLDGDVIGHLVDEIGGVWSFEPKAAS